MWDDGNSRRVIHESTNSLDLLLLMTTNEMMLQRADKPSAMCASVMAEKPPNTAPRSVPLSARAIGRGLVT